MLTGKSKPVRGKQRAAHLPPHQIFPGLGLSLLPTNSRTTGCQRGKRMDFDEEGPILYFTTGQLPNL